MKTISCALLFAVAAIASAQIPEKFTNLQVFPKDIAKKGMAMSHEAVGNKDKARADLQKIVASNPTDDWAKKELEKLDKK